MVLTEKGRFFKTVYKKNGEHANYLIRIPNKLVDDSAFPFKPNIYVRIKIKGGKLVIEKV